MSSNHSHEEERNVQMTPSVMDRILDAQSLTGVTNELERAQLEVGCIHNGKINTNHSVDDSFYLKLTQ